MRKSFIKSLAAGVVVALSTLGASSSAAASEAAHKIEHQKWGFKGAFGTYDQMAVQRGYQVYREVCSSCHALEHLSFRHLGEKGGPYYDPENPNPNDNAAVKAFAKDWEIPAIDQDNGDEIFRPGIPADKFPLVYPNAIAAAASNGGAVPPDLSVITKARVGGPDYIYALLTSYGHENDDGTYQNPVFPGGIIKMAPPLSDELIEYAPVSVTTKGHDGKAHTEMVAAPVATAEQMARDVTEFLTWAGDPKMEVRKKVGFATFLFLFIFSLLLFATYKQVWRNVKH